MHCLSVDVSACDAMFTLHSHADASMHLTEAAPGLGQLDTRYPRPVDSNDWATFLSRLLRSS